MSIAVVNSSGFQNPASGQNKSYSTGWSVTANNALIALIAWCDSGGTYNNMTGVSDGQGSYTQDFSYLPNSHWQLTAFSLFDCVAGTHALSLTSPTSNSIWAFVVAEISGAGTSDSYDSAAAGFNKDSVAGTSTTVTSGTLSNVGDIVFTWSMNVTADVTWSSPAGWTTLGNSGGGNWPSGGFAYLIPGSTAPLSPSFGLSASGSWAQAIIGYQPAAAGLTVQDDAQWFQFIQNPSISQLPERVRRPRWRASRSGLYVPEHLKAA